VAKEEKKSVQAKGDGADSMSDSSGDDSVCLEDSGQEKSKKTLDLTKKKETKDMQFEGLIRSLVKEAVIEHLKEAKDEPPSESWVKFGVKVDDFINDMVKKAEALTEEGKEILHSDDTDTTESERYKYLSSRMGFLKNLSYKLAQKYEGLRREN
jgi:hypothetical protein